MKFLSKLFGKGFRNRSAVCFEISGIRFYHHNPPRGNIGDYLCSPRHYFEFVPAKVPLNIIGGGVYVDMGVKFSEKYGIDPNQTILWGVGESIRGINNLDKIVELPFLEWGCRDRDRVLEDRYFVPCCSCLHKMLDSPVCSEGVLLFVNADPKVSGSSRQSDLEMLAKRRGWNLLYNNCGESEFANALSKAKYIVTNSYHGAYWGLLSGRTVSLIGYSSKFYSLLFGLGVSAEHLLVYDRGDDYGLLNLLDNLDLSESGVCLDNAGEIRSLYRKINMNFLNRLVEKRIIESYRLLPRSALF